MRKTDIPNAAQSAMLGALARMDELISAEKKEAELNGMQRTSRDIAPIKAFYGKVRESYLTLVRSTLYVDDDKVEVWIQQFYNDEMDNTITSTSQMIQHLNDWGMALELLRKLKVRKGIDPDVDLIANKEVMSMFVKAGGEKALEAMKTCRAYHLLHSQRELANQMDNNIAEFEQSMEMKKSR